MSRALLASLLVWASPALAQDARYFSAIEDLPIAPALRETDAGAAFAGADGRIVAATAQGPGSGDGVAAFYRRALPALGWSLSPGGDEIVYLRGRERLVLSLSEEGQTVRLDVRLVVAPASMDAD
jgi:hypothetical protein